LEATGRKDVCRKIEIPADEGTTVDLQAGERE